VPRGWDPCLFDPELGPIPVLAAIDGADLVVLTRQGTFRKLFGFTMPANTVSSSYLVSRGDFLGAMVVAQPSAGTTEAELLLVHLDGTVVFHHQESVTAEAWGGGSGIVGNAAGTFAFSLALGNAGRVWVAAADGRVLGPASGYTFTGTSWPMSPYVEPDARGRVVVTKSDTSAPPGLFWLDPCTGVARPTLLDNGGVGPFRWGAKLFGIDGATGTLATETADGVTTLAMTAVPANVPPWDFAATGFALFDLPPYPTSLSNRANLLVADLSGLAERPAPLAYPTGLTPVPAGAWLSQVGDSNNPAGFGLDSRGQVTMFLGDPSGATHLETTVDGTTWTTVGGALEADPSFGAELTLLYVESGGTYLVTGIDPAVGGQVFRVVRPSTGVEASLPAPGDVSADGACASALGSLTQLTIVDATTGSTFSATLPTPATTSGWTSTWIPGDDAAMYAPYL